MKKNTTKRSLLASVLALVMCVTMLVGTTFAWFTDSASTAVNKIESGTLHVDIVDKDGNSLDGKTLSFKNVNGDANILWEPGATFNLDSFRIVNTGKLALKYKVIINGVNGNAKLLEAIDFTVKIGDAEKVALADWEGILLPEGKTATTDNEVVGATDFITISGTMKKEAGNEYQGLSIDGIGITVVATQYTYENDSNGNTYDQNAPIVNVTPENAQSVLDKLDGYATVKLGAGTYDTLYLRPAKGNANTALKDGVANYRTITGLTIVGGEGVTVKGIKVGSDVNLSNDDFVEVNNLTIQNVTFTSNGSTNGFEATAGRSAVNGVTMDGCKMTAGEGFEQTGDEGNLYKSKIHVSNVVIKNCEVDGIYRLATFDTVTNATIEGNKIDKVTGHGILFGTATANGIDGALVIKNNSADGLTCRFLRMDRVAPTASLNISGNNITNYNNQDDFGFTSDADRGSGRYYSVDYMKVTNVADGASVTISNNTLNVAESYGARLTYIRINNAAYNPDGSLIYSDINNF